MLYHRSNVLKGVLSALKQKMLFLCIGTSCGAPIGGPNTGGDGQNSGNPGNGGQNSTIQNPGNPSNGGQNSTIQNPGNSGNGGQSPVNQGHGGQNPTT